MLDVQEYIPSLYRKLWQALGLKFSDPKDYYACEDESYRQLTDIFRKMSRDLEKPPVEAFSAASGSPIDRFADKIKGAVLDVSQDDRTTRTEKAIDSIFGAIKKSIRDAVAAEKAKTDKRNSFLDKVVGALDHVVTDVPAAPLPMGIGDRIARNYKKYLMFLCRLISGNRLFIYSTNNRNLAFCNVGIIVLQPEIRIVERSTAIAFTEYSNRISICSITIVIWLHI